MQLLLQGNQAYAQRKTIILIDKVLACFCLLLLLPYIVTIYLAKRCVSAKVIEQVTIYGQHQSVITLYQFSGEHYQCRELLSLWHVLTGKLCFIGEEFTFTCLPRPLMLSKPGIISIHQLKSQNGLAFESTSQILNRCYHHPSYYLFNLCSCLLNLIYSNNKRLTRRPYFKLFGLTIRNTHMSQMLNELILDSLSNKPTQLYAFVNTDCMNKIYTDNHYRHTLQQFKHIFADGLGMRIACHKLGIKLQDNLNGTDMFPRLCQLAEKRGAKIFLLGAKPDVARSCAQNMQAQYPNLQIVGCQHGYFEKHQTVQVIDKINASGANILLVAMGAPQQELWLAKHQHQLSVSCAIGVGGLFDFYANKVSRAPLWLRQIGMEWIWRLAQEPMRMWRRYILGNPLFLWRILKLNRTTKTTPQTCQYRPQHNHWHAHYVKFESKFQHVTKRLLDIILASSLLIIISPLLCMISLLIKLESSGPIIFKQQRVGLYNRHFTMFKLRSMQQNANQQQDALKQTNEMKGGVIFKVKQDPRITCIGYLIRKTSIDELPQLWNVIIGDMSLVGPRPALPSEVEQYNLHQRQRLNVVPGITCFWQVNGRSNLTFKQQVELDLHYIQQQSITTDIYLLAKTIPAVVTAKGAY